MELVERHRDRVFNFLLRRTGSAADAEDLTQETFVRAWLRIARYSPRWRFSTWLFTIAGRLAITHHRRRRRELAATQVVASRAATSGDPASRVDDREACALVWDVADRVLGREQRAALWLRFAEDLPPRAIARVLGRSPIAVRVMLFRARGTLAAHLDGRGERRHASAPVRRASPATAASTSRAPRRPEPVAGGA